MNGIIGMTELMLGTSVTAEQRDYLDTIRISGESLLSIINDILDFSKIEAGKFTLEPAPFDLGQMLGQTIRMMAPSAAAKGLELDYSHPPEMPRKIVGDCGRLRQVLVNLLANAIKFTTSGRVMLFLEKLQCEDGRVNAHFAVSDTGIGIAAEWRERIFAAFVQADGSATRRHGGTGLGLSITAKLVELMGGRIWVESKAGRGSTFHFTANFQLPSASEDLNPSTAAAADLRNLADSAAQRPLRILLAEDNAVNQKVATTLLERHGHTVRICANGAEAVQAYAEEPFDLILMDVQMPLKNGYDVTREIRLQEKATGLHIPIVALTAHAIKGDREECLAAGMDDYLCKPLNSRELFEAVARWGCPANPLPSARMVG